ncbi:MAG: response regulator [Candidatus Woesearchaeota archaeon]
MGLNVIIAEDEEGLRSLLISILNEHPSKPTVCAVENGEKLVHVFRDAAYEGKKYDLIITDYRMPRKTGIEAIVELGEDRPPVVLMTATPPERKECMGLDIKPWNTIAKDKKTVYCLLKPFRLSELFEVLSYYSSCCPNFQQQSQID